MNFQLEYFGNDKYKVLKILGNNQIEINGENYVPLSQQEIADIAHFSKLKTNKIINELIDVGCVEVFQNKRGKYKLTKRANIIIKYMQNSLV